MHRCVTPNVQPRNIVHCKNSDRKLPGSWDFHLKHRKNSFPGHVELQGKSWIFQPVPPSSSTLVLDEFVAFGPRACAQCPRPPLRLPPAQSRRPPALPALSPSFCCCSCVTSQPASPGATQPFPLVPTSGSHRGAGPGDRHHRDRLWLCLQDQEGDVPHRGAALQGVPHQADGHAPQHQPQLRALHHPQPREEGRAPFALILSWFLLLITCHLH